MVEPPVRVRLTDCRTGGVVTAQLVELTAKIAKTKVDAAWWRDLGVSKSRRRQEGDHGWKWADRIGAFRNVLAVESVAVQTADGDVQGAMIYRVDGGSVLAKGEGAVYVDRVAAAPRNREGLVAEPLYRGAGTSLIRWAAYHSHSLGLGGRLVLASLPNPDTISFYERLGFRATPAEEEDMVVYELEPPHAQALIAQDESLT
jgi:GNAT superfamily N-acetyltransferase